MTATTLAGPAAPAAAAENGAPFPTWPPPPEQRVAFSGVTWEEYEAFGKLLADRPVKLTYDRGDFEITVVSPAHEMAKKRLARLVETLTLALDVPIASRG